MLVKHSAPPRPYWSLDRIVELSPGQDDLIRIAKIMKLDHTTVFTSISNLYPLEVDSGDSLRVDERANVTICDADSVSTEMHRKNTEEQTEFVHPKFSRKPALKIKNN